MVSTRRASSKKRRKTSKGTKSKSSIEKERDEIQVAEGGQNKHANPKRIVFGDDDVDDVNVEAIRAEVKAAELAAEERKRKQAEGDDDEDEDSDAPMEVSLSQAREDVAKVRKAEAEAAPKQKKRKRQRAKPTKDEDEELSLDVIEEMMREQQERRERGDGEDGENAGDGPVVVRFQGSRKTFGEDDNDDDANPPREKDGFKLVVLDEISGRRTADAVARQRGPLAPKAADFLAKYLGGARHGARVSLAEQKSRKKKTRNGKTLRGDALPSGRFGPQAREKSVNILFIFNFIKNNG